jgi:hypothetical protein
MVYFSTLFLLYLAVAAISSNGFRLHERIRPASTSWSRSLSHGINSHAAPATQSTVDIVTQIHCNVELNADYIEAVGFDMDYTLAQVRCILYG